MLSIRKGIAWVFALPLALALCAIAVPAYAQTSSVSGADSYCGQNGSSTVQVYVVGNQGDAVYVNVQNGGKTVARAQECVLDDSASDGSTYVVSLSLPNANFSTSGSSYTVSVYGSKTDAARSANALYTGTVQPVFASNGTVSTLVALRTIGSEARGFCAPTTVSFDGTPYTLDKGDQGTVQTDGSLVYGYSQTSDAASGTIRYIDCKTGALLRTDSVVIPSGGTAVASIPETITVNSQGYRVMTDDTSVTMPTEGYDRVYACSVVSQTSQVTGSYDATVRYVDETGTTIFTDAGTRVTNGFTYTAPTSFYKTVNGVAKVFTLASVDLNGTTQTGDRGSFTFPAATAASSDKTVTVHYTSADINGNPGSASAPLSFTVREINGYAGGANGTEVAQGKTV